MEIEVIYGPPGTGKTTELLNILAKEIEDVPLNKIAYVSYTKEGAEQGKNRAAKQLNTRIDDLPYFRTLHSMAFRELKLKRGDVIGKDDYRLFSETVGMKFTGYYTEDFYNNDDRYLFYDILYRNSPTTAERYLEGLDPDILRFVRQNYKRYKKHYNIFDYTDMIEQFNIQDKSVPVDVAFVDEAQDLTTLQWAMIWKAFRNCKRIYIAGDDDQAIYEWSGADVAYFLRIAGDNFRVLNHSYRLPSAILEYAKKISSHISKRVSKEYEGTKEEGNVYRITSIEELPIDNKESWMILSRNRCFLRNIMEMLQSNGYVYTYKRKPSIDPVRMKAINAYEKVRKSPYVENKYLRMYLRFLKVVSYKEPWYNNFNWDVDEITYYRTVIGHHRHTEDITIYIDTIHSVKGAEADNVVILPDITKQVYENLEQNPDSEHRVFYVGVTRARHNLYIVDSGSRYEYPLIDILGE